METGRQEGGDEGGGKGGTEGGREGGREGAKKTIKKNAKGRTILPLVAVILAFELKQVPLLRVVKEGELGEVVLHVGLVLGGLLLRLGLA